MVGSFRMVVWGGALAPAPGMTNGRPEAAVEAR
jgi:hypothetical protein